MPKPILRLKRGRDQRARTHPWIFKGDVADVSDVAPGDAVTVLDAGGRFVGRGLFNPRPALCCRIFTWADEALDRAWLARRLAAAVEARAGLAREAMRLVWSEADGLPGLVVDRYGPALAVQCLTLGVARRRAEIVAALRSLLGDLPVTAADDGAMAGLEGFEPAGGWLDTPGPDEIVVAEGSVRLAVRPGAGHKTGLYLDQADNRIRVGAAGGRGDVLDVFAYAGAFACHALAGGAKRAVCIESSPEAVAAARRNFELNGVAERAEVRAVSASSPSTGARSTSPKNRWRNRPSAFSPKPAGSGSTSTASGFSSTAKPAPGSRRGTGWAERGRVDTTTPSPAPRDDRDRRGRASRGPQGVRELRAGGPSGSGSRGRSGGRGGRWPG